MPIPKTQEMFFSNFLSTSKPSVPDMGERRSQTSRWSAETNSVLMLVTGGVDSWMSRIVTLLWSIIRPIYRGC
jgi:hypothetical protein